MENALPKIGRGGEEGCLSQIRQMHIYVAIKEVSHSEGRISIETACKLLHVARSAYHKWASGKLSQRAAENGGIFTGRLRISIEKPRTKATAVSTMICDMTTIFTLMTKGLYLPGEGYKIHYQVQQPRLHKASKKSAISCRKPS